jgi:hypothetical protein
MLSQTARSFSLGRVQRNIRRRAGGRAEGERRGNDRYPCWFPQRMRIQSANCKDQWYATHNHDCTLFVARHCGNPCGPATKTRTNRLCLVEPTHAIRPASLLRHCSGRKGPLALKARSRDCTQKVRYLSPRCTHGQGVISHHVHEGRVLSCRTGILAPRLRFPDRPDYASVSVA